MTPLDTVPLRLAGRTSVLTLIGRALSTRLARTRLLTLAVLRLLFRFVLVVAGLGCLSAAAWLIAVPFGLTVAGLSLLVLEWAVKAR